ncbi:unnamed protein product [Polarella glacialis]|uniref:Uncharacterized protein n=3 Tax=Polarella glacialis TaxID=89957 RepID=A0A813F4X2_POLGL|nr:unnamed protein product [Polarella glacialis]
MGENLSCSTHCAPSCISRQHPPGAEEPYRRNVGRAYPVADPVDANMNWQSIAVRHAWKKAALLGEIEEGPNDGQDCVDVDVLPLMSQPLRPPSGSPRPISESDGRGRLQNAEVVKI